jgi:hypothetical protein
MNNVMNDAMDEDQFELAHDPDKLSSASVRVSYATRGLKSSQKPYCERLWTITLLNEADQ